jgi:uncharacterized membrane protein YraQ (UPF0718 family)
MVKFFKKYFLIIVYIIFLIGSFVLDFEKGKEVGWNLYLFAIDMLKVIPCSFILIGLFEVWIKKETVEKHLGKNLDFKSYIWAIILASTTVGGIIMALPIAHSLLKKGASPAIVFTYIGAAAVYRVPMTIFEISLIGIKFSLIRLIISLPLIIILAVFLERIFNKNKMNYI